MSELTLESLARRLADVERRLNEKQATSAKDWRIAAGMFTGREFSKIVDEEGRKIREADREEGRQGIRRVILLDTDKTTASTAAAPWSTARRGPGTDRHHYCQR